MNINDNEIYLYKEYVWNNNKNAIRSPQESKKKKCEKINKIKSSQENKLLNIKVRQQLVGLTANKYENI